VAVALRNTNGLEGTEFTGGWLTGPLLSMIDPALFAALSVLYSSGSVQSDLRLWA